MNKQEAIQQLWQTSFHDSEEFIRFYFRHKYEDGNALLHVENGRPLSALLMLPYPMRWTGKTLMTSYISGACTLPEARNRGLMSNLLRNAFGVMHRRNIALSTLIPAEEWLFGYYARLGYAPVFKYAQEFFDARTKAPVTGGHTVVPETYDAPFFQNLFPYFKRKMEERDACIQHPMADYQAVTEEIYLSGGRIAVSYPNCSSAPSGMAFAIQEKKHLLVKELLCETEEDKQRLLHALAATQHLPEIILRTPSSSNAIRYGMARITHAQSMLRHLAQQHPSCSLTLRINDPQLPANNGCYVLEKGTCFRPSKATAELETDIPTLTQALLGFHPEQLPATFSRLVETTFPHMSLMMD